MKNVATIVFGLFLAVFSVNAASENTQNYFRNFNNGQSYIFVEGGVEFSVFPDGQFDFVFLGTHGNQLNVNAPGVNISFNGGFNYDAYVQYDSYGAVIQIENVPVFYDEFGRIAQAGNVEIRYNDRRIVRIGGMRIFYNNFGYFSHFNGFISPWYTAYVFRPWHTFYARPFFNNCIVYDFPYRRFYTPFRYGYAYHRNNFHRGNQFYNNGRRDFLRPGSRIHQRDGRTVVNRDFNPNRVNTAVSNTSDRGGRNERNDVASSKVDRNEIRSNSIANNSNTINRGKPLVNSNTSRIDRNTTQRGKPVINSTSSKIERKTVQRGKPVVTNSSYNKSRVTKPSKVVRETNKTRPVVTQKNTSVNRANTRATNRTYTSSTRNTNSNNRGTTTRRGRG